MENEKKYKLINYFAIGISLFALFISILTSYKQILKPFALDTRINPVISMQYKANLGLYINADFFNNSPQYGLITKIAVVLYKTTNEDDKYLLEFIDFRKIDSTGVYSSSEEKLPLFFEPWQRQSKTMNFIYLVLDSEFPLSSGTYTCEFLIWDGKESKARYQYTNKFEITSDLIDRYKKNRELKSTSLIDVNLGGYTPLKSKKLTYEEYSRLY